MTIEEWAKDFKSYINELNIPRDDYNGIMEYIDDAITLLKEQGAVEPFHRCIGKDFSLIDNTHYDYCHYWRIAYRIGKAGRSVKWNE